MQLPGRGGVGIANTQLAIMACTDNGDARRRLRVVVTGASSGIGAATALFFLSKGHKVAFVARRADKMQSLALDKYKDDAFVVAKDLSTPNGPREAIAEAVSALGGLDVLVNNAGAGAGIGPIASVSEAQFQKCFDLNFMSAFRATQAAAPHLVTSKGSIVNVSSIVAEQVMPNFGAYSISKAAMDALTRSAAVELGQNGVRVNSVLPSVVQTEALAAAGMDDAVAAEFKSTAVKATPLGRIGTVEDIAAFIYFLADGSQSGWVTGQSLFIDGCRSIVLNMGASA